MDIKIRTKSEQEENVASKLGFLYHIFINNRVPPFFFKNIVNKLDNNEIVLPTTNKSIAVTSGLFAVPNIPDYLSVSHDFGETEIKCKKISQYQGFLVNLNDAKDSTSYLKGQLSKRSIRDLYAKQRKLEGNHEITYTFHYGNISKDHFDFLFSEFYKMLENRFLEKKMYNNNLRSWKYYYDVAYPMILDKKASLFVIYDKEKPIAMSLNFHLKDIVFCYIPTYHIDYSKYNMGDISMLKHIEWCKQNDFSIFDLSMGHTNYKIKWCNHIYRYDYHIFFNPKSLISRLKCIVLTQKLTLRQFLRDKNIIGKKFQMDKFLFKRRVKQLANFNWKES